MNRSMTRRQVMTLAAVSAAALPGRTGLAQQASPSPTGPRTIKHALGERAISGTPARIVALEWEYPEALVAVGVQPVGVADIEGYNTWVNVEPELAADVVDVGTRQEPSLESIAALGPDLIIGIQFRHETIYEDLNAIAPTLIFNPYPESDEFNQYDDMEQTFLAIAEAVNRLDQGQEVLEHLHARYDELKETVAAAGKMGEPFVLAQAYSQENIPQIRLFLDGSLAVQILERIGLENVYEGSFDPYGFNTVGVEALAAIQDAIFFYVVQDDDNVFADQLQNDPVWSSLTFVKEERTYPLGGDTWVFGGPLSADLLATKAVELVTT